MALNRLVLCRSQVLMEPRAGEGDAERTPSRGGSTPPAFSRRCCGPHGWGAKGALMTIMMTMLMAKTTMTMTMTTRTTETWAERGTGPSPGQTRSFEREHQTLRTTSRR